MEYYTTAQGISFLFFNSAVSKAYWLVEHAGSVCCPWCWNMCCISGADCRDLVEKTRDEFVDQNQVRYWEKKKKKKNTTSLTQSSWIQFLERISVYRVKSSLKL